MSRVYATAALTIVVMLAWWQYSSAIIESNKYKQQSLAYAQELKAEKSLRQQKENLLLEANARAIKYIEEKKEIENKAKEDNKCIADGTCGVVVRYKKAICSDLHNSDTTKPRIDESSGTNNADFARWYVALEEAIKKNELKILQLQKDLLVRSSYNYCLDTQHK